MTSSILQTAAERLNYLGDVQNLLASNLANIDTPDYRPFNAVSFSDYVNDAGGNIQMLQNNVADLPGASSTPAIQDPMTPPKEHSPDGNAVAMDKQLVQVSNNETQQQLTTTLYQAYMGMFKTALGSSAS
jgi:flagellar basal-body rod protein FlgB